MSDHRHAGFCRLQRPVFPVVHHQAHGGEGVADIPVELRLPLELGDAAFRPVVAGLAVGAAVAQRGEVHHGGGLAMRPPEFRVGGEIRGLHVEPLRRRGIRRRAVLVKLAA